MVLTIQLGFQFGHTQGRNNGEEVEHLPAGPLIMGQNSINPNQNNGKEAHFQHFSRAPRNFLTPLVKQLRKNAIYAN